LVSANANRRRVCLTSATAEERQKKCRGCQAAAAATISARQKIQQIKKNIQKIRKTERKRLRLGLCAMLITGHDGSATLSESADPIHIHVNKRRKRLRTLRSVALHLHKQP